MRWGLHAGVSRRDGRVDMSVFAFCCVPLLVTLAVRSALCGSDNPKHTGERAKQQPKKAPVLALHDPDLLFISPLDVSEATIALRLHEDERRMARWSLAEEAFSQRRE